jgi:hypothetical protein
VPPPIWAEALGMHILQIIVNTEQPKLVHVIYNHEQKTAVRMAIFEFDAEKENAQEIDYEEFPFLVKSTLKIVQAYIERLEDLNDIEEETEGQEEI